MRFPPAADRSKKCFRIYIKFSIWANFSFGTIFLMRQLLRVFALAVAIGVATIAATSAMAAEQFTYDVVIRNGRLLDGLGNPWVRASIAIKDGRIAEIGRCEGRGRREIDAHDRY